MTIQFYPALPTHINPRDTFFANPGLDVPRDFEKSFDLSRCSTDRRRLCSCDSEIVLSLREITEMNSSFFGKERLKAMCVTVGQLAEFTKRVQEPRHDKCGGGWFTCLCDGQEDYTFFMLDRKGAPLVISLSHYFVRNGWRWSIDRADLSCVCRQRVMMNEVDRDSHSVLRYERKHPGGFR